MGGKSDAPAAPDYSPLIAAYTKSADQNNALAQQQFAWAKEQATKDQATIAPMISQMTDNAKQSAAFAKQQQDFYTGTYQPMEKKFATDASNWDSPDREGQQSSAAQANVAQQFDAARTSAQQNLESYGIDPSATRYAALDIGTRTAQAAAGAAAGTKAIDDTQAQGMQYRGAAINVGRGYPGAINGSQGTSNSSASGATAGVLSGTQTAASTEGTSAQYAGLGMQGLNGAVNAMNTGYQNQLGAYQAQNQASSGWGSALGLAGGLLLKMKDGGSVQPPTDGSQGGTVPSQQELAQDDGPDPAQMYARNSMWAQPPGPNGYQTQLPPEREAQFQDWVQKNKVPFDPSPHSDYDMRGYFHAMANQDPRARTEQNANDGQMHFPDQFKTPFHKSFSNESQYAKPNAPSWNDKDQLVDQHGNVVYDERAENQKQYSRGGAVYAAGGGAIPQDGSQGGAIPTAASPTGGQAIDDVPARLTPGEFVIPKDTVSWLGEKHFQNLIQKSREEAQKVQAKPEVKAAPPQAPTFVSRPQAVPMG